MKQKGIGVLFTSLGDRNTTWVAEILEMFWTRVHMTQHQSRLSLVLLNQCLCGPRRSRRSPRPRRQPRCLLLSTTTRTGRQTDGATDMYEYIYINVGHISGEERFLAVISVCNGRYCSLTAL